MLKFTKVVHYDNSDTDFGGDYFGIELFNQEGKRIKKYGDYYHDKGDLKCQEFISGVEYALDKKATVEVVKKADGQSFV